MNKYLSLFTDNLMVQGVGDPHFVIVLMIMSFMGGLIASISPCSLSMLPIIVGYIGGYSTKSPIKTLIQMMFFIFGTSIIFTLIGIICAVTGKVFTSLAGGYFTIILASLILVMGLKIVGILDFEFPVIIKKMPNSEGHSMYLYPILLGAVFALVGTPCSTPILAGIMAFASLSTNIILAVLMLFLFSLGQGLILVIAAVFTSSVKSMKHFAKASDILMKSSGILLILASVYIYYKIFSPLL